jgi:hypothetical protein
MLSGNAPPVHDAAVFVGQIDGQVVVVHGVHDASEPPMQVPSVASQAPPVL